MSNLSIYSVSAINTPAASYPDSLLEFKQYQAGYEQGFAFNKINALKNTVDSSINNYTSHYLTNKVLFTDMFNVNEKIHELKTITTPLIFDNNKYLYIYSTYSEEPTASTCRVLLTSFIGYEKNINFELEFLNETFLRVKHNNGKLDYFLNATSDNSVMFYSYSSELPPISSERNDMFRYYIDNTGYLQLFKRTVEGLRIATLSGDKLVLALTSAPSGVRSTNNIININYNFTEVYPSLNSSWISYNILKPNELDISFDKSSFDNKNQYILYTNYNSLSNTINLNYIPLNNIRSEKNYIKRGANLLQGAPGIPDVDFRDYNSLQTGNSQEKGNDNISLTYTWYDKDIKVIPGTDTYFTTPSSIYPFERLNINDTKFTLNGSFAGKTPLLSDRVFCLKESTFSGDNGRYLCTWLFKENSNKPGKWLDRYYYPDLTIKEDALGGIPVYEPSFYDSIDSIELEDKESLIAKTYFDKQSDLCLIPNTRYYYSRIGEEEINSAVSSSSPTFSGFTEYYDIKNNRQYFSSTEIKYDGTKYNKYKLLTDSNKDVTSFTISFDAYIDPAKKYGYQILGNLTNKGFGIINDEAVTPFIYTSEGKTLKIFNSDGGSINTITFRENIVDVISSDAVGDIFVICQSGYIYKVNAIGIKQKLEIEPRIINYSSFYQDNESIVFYVRKRPTAPFTPVAYEMSKSTLEVREVPITPFIPYSGGQIGDSSIVKYNGTYFTLPGQRVKYIDAKNVFYTINDETIVRQNLQTGEFTQFIAVSSRNLIDYTITTDNSIAILYDKTKVAIFDSSRKPVQIADYSSIIGTNSVFTSIDICREYTSSGQAESFIMSFADTDFGLNLFYGRSSQIINTGLKCDPRNNSYNIQYTTRNKSSLTNFNHFKQIDTFNGLQFKLTLSNYLSSEDITTKNISFNFEDIDKGYHTFTYIFDSLKGSIVLYVNGEVYATRSVSPGKYYIQPIFNDDIYVSSTGFYNGLDLATFLGQPGYYFTKDLKMRNLFLYNRPITDGEALALNLYNESINDLILSIPAGQRNNIEEIERYFKFAPVSSSSKKINIYIKNSGIKNEIMKNNIKNLILSDTLNSLPIGVTINDIQFIDFKQ